MKSSLDRQKLMMTYLTSPCFPPPVDFVRANEESAASCHWTARWSDGVEGEIGPSVYTPGGRWLATPRPMGPQHNVRVVLSYWVKNQMRRVHQKPTPREAHITGGVVCRIPGTTAVSVCYNC